MMGYVKVNVWQTDSLGFPAVQESMFDTDYKDSYLYIIGIKVEFFTCVPV